MQNFVLMPNSASKTSLKAYFCKKKKRKKNELLANNLASIITDFALFTRVPL